MPNKDWLTKRNVPSYGLNRFMCVGRFPETLFAVIFKPLGAGLGALDQGSILVLDLAT
jgi:hypothetical protein